MNRTHYRTKPPLWEAVLLRILDGVFCLLTVAFYALLLYFVFIGVFV